MASYATVESIFTWNTGTAIQIIPPLAMNSLRKGPEAEKIEKELGKHSSRDTSSARIAQAKMELENFVETNWSGPLAQDGVQETMSACLAQSSNPASPLAAISSDDSTWLYNVGDVSGDVAAPTVAAVQDQLASSGVQPVVANVDFNGRFDPAFWDRWEKRENRHTRSKHEDVKQCFADAGVPVFAAQDGALRC